MYIYARTRAVRAQVRVRREQETERLLRLRGRRASKRRVKRNLIKRNIIHSGSNIETVHTTNLRYMYMGMSTYMHIPEARKARKIYTVVSTCQRVVACTVETAQQPLHLYNL